MELKLHFHNQKDVKVPEGIELLQDFGHQSIHVMDGPRRIVSGQVLLVRSQTREQMDEWVKQYPDVYRA